MIAKFETYLGKLPLTSVVKNRINEVINMNLKIHNIEINDILLCEMKNNEGSRNYTSLWLFSDSLCIECKNFLQVYDFDSTPISKKVDYCSIIPTNFDFENPTELSIVKVHFHFGTGIAGDLIATEQNCLSAVDIYKKYIVSNLKI
jgi:hypothetical protein